MLGCRGDFRLSFRFGVIPRTDGNGAGNYAANDVGFRRSRGSGFVDRRSANAISRWLSYGPLALPSFVFPLVPGDSLRRLPRELLSHVAPVNGSWQVSDNFIVKSLFNVRGGCTLLRGRGRVGLTGVWGSVGNVDLHVRDVDMPTPESRHATHVGMPPSWLFWDVSPSRRDVSRLSRC